MSARTGYNSLPLRLSRVWLGPYSEARKPRSKGGGVLSLCHEARDEGKGHLTPDPGMRATIWHSMEDTNTPSRGRGQDEERFQNQKNALRMSEGAPWSPNQILKNQRDNPGRVTKTGQDPQPTRN